MTISDLYRSLAAELNEVEDGLEESIDLEIPLLYETSTHLLKAGGKRIRPLFVLVSGQFGDYRKEELITVAITLELIHMATLVHDDVIDDAATRRGRETVKAKWDNKIAVYTGDYILAKALMRITEIPDERVQKILSRAIMEMSIGEIEQLHDFYRIQVGLRHYLRRIKRKTALLISISAALGGLVSGAPQDVVHLLRRFGYYVGMAFQITDDILDFVGTEAELGKPAGSDIRQGNITLPTIYSLKSSPERERLSHWIEAQELEERMSDILTLIR
ncbi:MAG: polyprenyl synthetase family protein, partial [Thermicanus sp.]|nr:polyprenyl synthetase family protein [Thermicanus sp.]